MGVLLAALKDVVAYIFTSDRYVRTPLLEKCFLFYAFFFPSLYFSGSERWVLFSSVSRNENQRTKLEWIWMKEAPGNHPHSSNTQFLYLSNLSGVSLVLNAGFAQRDTEKAHGMSASPEWHRPVRSTRTPCRPESRGRICIDHSLNLRLNFTVFSVIIYLHNYFDIVTCVLNKPDPLYEKSSVICTGCLRLLLWRNSFLLLSSWFVCLFVFALLFSSDLTGFRQILKHILFFF